MLANILTTWYGQIGLMALFVIALVVAAKLLNKRAKRRKKRSRNKV